MQLVEQRSIQKATYWAWVICGLGAIYYCYEYFLRITPSVITPELMRTYNLTGAEVGNLSAFYYHAYMPMQILVGLLMDRFGPRRLLTLACLLCAIGTYMFAGTHSLTIAMIGRFLVGFGSAFAFVGALKLATIWLPPNRFALVSGIITCLGMLGAMAGDIVLRRLVDVTGWQATIYASAAAGVVLAVILWAVIRDVNPQHSSSHAHVTHFRELMTGLWGAVKNKQIWLSSFIGFLLYISLSAFGEMWGIPYLEQAHGLSKTQAASANAMIFLGWAVGAPFWGWFSDFVERRRLLLIVSSTAATVLACVMLYISGLSLFSTCILLFLLGFFTSSEILVFAICREVSSIKIVGTAVALTNMIVMVGGNIFQPLMGKILDLNWASTMVEGARVYPASAYALALTVLPVGFGLAIILSFFVRETYGKIKYA
jgi:sugar phosphate permease